MTFRRIFAHLLVLASTATLAVHAQSTPEATTRQWIAAFNAGDMAKAASLNAASTTIIDEFAPYTWSGPKAFADWGAAFESDARAAGLTEPKVTIGAAMVSSVNGNQAYLVFPATYTYKRKGTPMREPARMVLVLHKEGAAWKVASWAWTGTVPKPAAK